MVASSGRSFTESLLRADSQRSADTSVRPEEETERLTARRTDPETRHHEVSAVSGRRSEALHPLRAPGSLAGCTRDIARAPLRCVHRARRLRAEGVRETPRTAAEILVPRTHRKSGP